MRLALVATGLFFLIASPARADEPRAILLPVDGDSSIRSLADEIERAFMRQGRKLVRSSLRLEDLMLAVGCRTASISCLREIGQNVKAGGLIISRARRLKEGVELSLRYFDVKKGADAGNFVRLLPAGSADREKILNDAIRGLLGAGEAPASQEPTGGLSISASIPYVEIVLDGQARGTVPLELRNLPAGSYTVVARREGYLTNEQKVLVKPDRTNHLQIEMAPDPSRPHRPGYVQSIRTPTWVVAGTGLLCFAIGAGFAAHLKAQQDHLDHTQGITLDEIRQMQDYKETGQRDALAANILFGLGGASLVAALVLSYFDYRHGRGEAVLQSQLAVRPRSVSFARNLATAFSFW